MKKLYTLRLIQDPYNERREYKMVETHLYDLYEAEERARNWDRALVLDSSDRTEAGSARIVWSKGI